MKKTIIAIISIILVAFSLYGYKGIKRLKNNKEAEGLIELLPNFSFFSTENSLFTRNSLKKNIPIIIFYFNPDCDQCEYEAVQLVNNREFFKNTQIIMVSTSSIKKIKTFFNTFKLNQLPMLTMLYDKEYKFEQYFGSAIFPTVLIYSKDWLFRKKYKGEIKTEVIIECLK